jgi:hypothetical protein
VKKCPDHLLAWLLGGGDESPPFVGGHKQYLPVGVPVKAFFNPLSAALCLGLRRPRYPLERVRPLEYYEHGTKVGAKRVVKS